MLYLLYGRGSLCIALPFDYSLWHREQWWNGTKLMSRKWNPFRGFLFWWEGWGNSAGLKFNFHTTQRGVHVFTFDERYEILEFCNMPNSKGCHKFQFEKFKKLEKKTPNCRVFSRAMDIILIEMHYDGVNVQKSCGTWLHPGSLLSQTVCAKELCRDLSNQIHIMFSVSYYFKGNFDVVHFNKAALPPEQRLDSWFPQSTEQSATAYFII